MANIVIETEQFILRELTMQYYPEPFTIDKTRGWIEWNLENYRQYGFR